MMKYVKFKKKCWCTSETTYHNVYLESSLRCELNRWYEENKLKSHKLQLMVSLEEWIHCMFQQSHSFVGTYDDTWKFSRSIKLFAMITFTDKKDFTPYFGCISTEVFLQLLAWISNRHKKVLHRIVLL